MNKIQHQAAVMIAAIAAQGLAIPSMAVAADVPFGQALLSKSASTADCQRRGGGGGGGRAGAAPRAQPGGGGGGNRGVRTNASSNVNHNVNANRNTNVNRNANVNVNRNVNVNVDNDYRGGWDNHYHPIATGVAIGATAAVTAAVIGSVVYSVPPSCSTVIVNGISYSQCGNTWYAPRYSGTTVQYVVVNSPQ
jgi:hypothetical protein